ncbi:MAG TPA: HNH endonuclease signature motif containing protein, partial [Trebonia sp.]
DAARDLVAAASGHPRSRWCVTVTGKDGEAIAHGCASGRHPWTPETTRAGPDQDQRAQLAALLRQLGITLTPIAKETCDHAQREDRYRPSRQLRHLIWARTTTCPAPGCGAQAIYNEVDHTVPWPAGTTDECDLSPPSSRHHHAKHAPGWELTQPEPGVMQWRLPSGRIHTTRPTRYDE